MSQMTSGALTGYLLLGVLLSLVLITGCEKSPSPVDAMKDWSDSYLTGTGYSTLKGQERLSALEEAKEDAYSRLEAHVLRLKIDSKQDVAALLTKDEKVKVKLKTFIRGAKVVTTEFLPASNQISVTLELYLGADFRATLGLREKERQEQKPSATLPSGGLGILRP
jgi:hypothetical protein